MTETLLMKVFCAKPTPTQSHLVAMLITIRNCLRDLQPIGAMNISADGDTLVRHSDESRLRFCETSDNDLENAVHSRGGVAFAENNGISIDVGRPPIDELCYAVPTCLIRMNAGRAGRAEGERLFSRLLKEIVWNSPCNLAFVCSESACVHVYPPPLGIRAGLADLYWISVFGCEYVDLIGSGPFARLQAYEVINLPWGGRWLQVTDSLMEAISAETISPRGRAKGALGDDLFFAANKRPDLSGSRSFFDLHLWLTLKRSLAATKQSKAARTPYFGDV